MADVRVISPDGRSGTIPEEQLSEAQAQGYKLPGDASADAEAGAGAAMAPAVRVRSPDGRVGTIPHDQLQDAIDQGYEDLRGSEYRTTGQKLATVGEGLARGATMGASDAVQTAGAGLGTGIGNWLADKLVGETPRATARGLDAPLAPERPLFDTEAAKASYADIQGRREANKGLAVGSEIAGAVVPSLLSGGVGSAAAAARITPAGQLANLSTKMGGLLMQRAGTTALGRIGALAATGAAEGMVDNATRAVMDDLAKGDLEVSADRMLDAAWDGAKWGGAIGVGLGALAEGVSAAARGVTNAKSYLVDKASSNIDQAGKAAFRALGRSSQSIQNAAERVGGEAAVGETLLKRGVIQAGDTADAIADRLPAELETAGNELGSLLDEVGADKLDGAKLWEKIENEVISPLDRPGSRDIAESIRSKLEKSGIKERLLGPEYAEDVISPAARGSGEMEAASSGLMGEAAPAPDLPASGIMGAAPPQERAVSMASKPVTSRRVRGVDSGLMGERPPVDNSITLRDLHEIRKTIDSRPDLKWAHGGAGPIDPSTEAMRDVRRTIERSFEDASDAASRARGVEDFAQRLKTAKREYSHLAIANQLADREAMRVARNNRLGLYDWIAGAAGFATMGPVGAGLALGSKVVRDRGESVLASTLYKLAQGGVAKERALSAAVENTMRSLVLPATTAAAPSAARFAAAMPAPSMSPKALQLMVKQAQELQDPNSPASAQLDAMTLQLASESPEFAQAIRDKVMRKASFIVEKLGPHTDPSDPLKSAPMPMDPVSKSRADRFLRAAADPSAALDRLANGQGSAEDLAVVREITPGIHKAYVDRVMKQLVGGGHRLSTAQQQKLHFALGVPVSVAQTPKYVSFYRNLIGGKKAQEEGQEGTQGTPPQRQDKFKGRDFKVDMHWASRADGLMGGHDD